MCNACHTAITCFCVIRTVWSLGVQAPSESLQLNLCKELDSLVRVLVNKKNNAGRTVCNSASSAWFSVGFQYLQLSPTHHEAADRYLLVVQQLVTSTEL